ncbi:MAG: 23S rRNA (adenine(2030)-N(6))-methyltransferase RlmJ [Rickettsiales bacterium]|nr:23S rRNA (adenine(2030)-N(6))-methyltransferase RlmJ [Rickettsiales bacterium]
MQIISGRERGRRLFLPGGARPTQNKARIALFNMLENILRVTNHKSRITVWDAFAGSGAFGVEFLSRYRNASVIFTDISADSFKTINKNVADMPGATIEMTDALNAVKRHGAAADIVFIDPPYSSHDLGISLVRKLAQIARPGTIIVWEMENTAAPVFSEELWAVLRDKTYGRARFIILERKVAHLPAGGE